MKRLLSHARNTLIILFSFFLPTQLGKHFFPDFSFINGIRIDYLSPTIYFTDILALGIIILHAPVVFQFIRQKRIIFIGLITLTIVVFALSPWVGVYRWVKGLEWMCLFAVFSAIKTAKPLFYRNLLIAFLMGIFLQLTLTLLQLSYKQSLQGIFYWLGERRLSLTTPDVAIATLGGPLFLRPYGTFSHPNSLGGFYLLVYFFTLTLPAFKAYPKLRSLTIFLSMLLVFLSFSKTAIAVFVVLNILIFATVFFKGKCRFCGISRVVVLIVVAAIFSLAQGDPYTIEKRITLVDNALDIIMTHPFTGVGLGNYLIAQATFTNYYSSFFLQPVHTIVVLFFAETGLLGMALLMLLYRSFLTLVNSKSFQFCFAVVFLTGMMDHYWLTLQQNFFLTAVVFGLIYSYRSAIITRLAS